MLGAFAWAVLILLGLWQGLGVKLFSLATIGVHVRLLLAIPLFFKCENVVEPLMKNLFHILRCCLICENEKPAFTNIASRISRMNESWIAEGICLILAYALPLANFAADLPGNTSELAINSARIGSSHGWTYVWYMLFCLPLYRFLLFRWLWRLALWCSFLWSLEKLELSLVPTHSDRAAGLGYLETVTLGFSSLVLSFSVVFSSLLAEELYLGTIVFESIYKPVLIILLLNILIFIAPLMIFRRKLKVCRAVGLMNYGIMAFRYVDEFDRKWIRSEITSSESRLGTPDLQSLADLTNSINVVLGMRVIPIGRRAFEKIMIAASLPFVPLILFKYKIPELLPLLKSFVGL
jgi:hypothetical protein